MTDELKNYRIDKPMDCENKNIINMQLKNISN